MRYIKTYEEKKLPKLFWKIKKDDFEYFVASLFHINCSESETEYFVDLFHEYENSFLGVYIYIHKDNYLDDVGWNVGDTAGYDWYIDNEYKYMGEIVPTEEDIDNVKMLSNANKYNL